MAEGIRHAAVGNSAQDLRRCAGAGLRVAGALALAWLGVALSSRAQSPAFQLANQTFPLTQVGKSTTQDVSFTFTDDISLTSFQIDPGYGEFTLNGFSAGCGPGSTLPAGTTCTVSITFAPALPGWASAPLPIARSAPLQIGFYDLDLNIAETATVALTGSGTGPVAALSPGLISDIVGSDTAVEDPANPYGGGGGPATAAFFNNPMALAVDGLGNLYIADTGNSVVRVVYKSGAVLAALIALENPGVTAVPGNIYTIAGTQPTLSPYQPYSGAGTDGGLATQSFLSSPSGVAVDAAGNVYISDTYNNAVRMVNAATGIINTVAGTMDSPGYSGDGSQATAAQLLYPFGIAVDGYGNLYIADEANSAIRVVYAGGTPLAALIVTDSAGTTNVSAANAGYIYTLAGGTYSVPGAGDGVLASRADLNYPTAVTTDSQGNVFIADSSDYSVRRIDGVTGLISTIAALGQQPFGLAVDASDNVYFGLPAACIVNEYSLQTLLTSAIAGDGICGASGDAGNAIQAGLSGAQDVAVDGTGSLYILEPDGVRYVNAAVTSLAFPQAQFGILGSPQTISITDADILNYPIGAPYLSSTIALAESSGTTGLAVTAPFQVVAPLPNPAPPGPVADCGANAMNLTPGQSCYLAVTEQSEADNSYADAATYPDNSVSFSAAPLTINLSATVIGTAPAVSLTGGPLSFAAVPGTGPSASQNLTLTNLSTTTPLAIASIAASAGFSASSNCGTMLAAGSSCAIAVSFSASTTGPLNGTVTVSDDASTGNGVQTASVSGTGAYPTVTLTGGPLTFSGAVVNEAGSAPQTLTLTNTSNVPLTISSIYSNVTNFHESDNCQPVLAANGNCSISIAFFASTTTTTNATLTVNDNASTGAGTQTAALQGTGAAPSVSVSASSISFPSTSPGATSQVSYVTLTNNGNAPLTFCTSSICFSSTGVNITPFMMTGNEPDMFEVVSNTCGATLAAGGQCTLGVAFTPNMPGYFSAALDIDDDNGGGLGVRYSIQPVNLTGSAFAPAGTSSFTITNPSFPATAVGQSATQLVNIEINSEVVLKSVAIPAGTSDFKIGSTSECPLDGSTVNYPGDTCPVSITFTPTAPGERAAPLILTTTEGGGTPYALAVTGVGTGPVGALTPGIITDYVGGSGAVCVGVSAEEGIPAANAEVGFLNGMALDSSGNLYLSDSMNFVIWRVDPSGVIHLYAGNPLQCAGYDQYLNGNGSPALGANIEDGGPLALDSAGGLYIGDNAANSAPSIRYINPATKIITSVVGNLSNTGGQGNGWEANTYFYPGSILQETVSTPNNPGPGSSNVNYLFRATTGGTTGPSAPNFPYTATQTVTDGSVIWVNAGAGTTSGVGCPAQTDSFGDGCTGANATLYGVSGIALDAAGNLYFADRYKLNTNGSAVYNAVVRRMDAQTGIVTIYAGNGTYGHSGDGLPATQAEIIPGDLAFDSGGNLYIDEGLQVRKVDASTGIITTVAGNGVASHYQQDVCYGDVGDGGPALSASFGGVTGIAFDAADDLYLMDQTGCNVRRVDAATQTITTIAGQISAYNVDSGNLGGFGDLGYGSAALASLAIPELVRVDGLGNLYIMELSRGVRKINVNQSEMEFSPYYEISDDYVYSPLGSFTGPMTATVLNAGNSGPLSFNSPYTDPLAYGISTADYTRDVSGPDCISSATAGLAPGTECPVSIDFTPTVPGSPIQDTEQITDNGALPTQTITLYGYANGSPAAVTLLPALLSFVSTKNVATAAQNLTLTNNTANGVPINSIDVSGSGAPAFAASNNCPSTLAAGASCQIAITFTPAALGQYIATVNVSDLVNGNPASQSAGLTGLAGTPNATLSDQLNFGQQEVGVPSAPKTLTLTSTGNVPLLISSISLAGANPEQFAISATTCGSSLAPLAHCTISVTFAPTTDSPTLNATTVPFQADVLVADDAANTPQIAILQGIGIGTAPLVLAIEETIHATDAPSLARPLTLSWSETIHVSDTPVLTQPTVLAITETIHVADSLGGFAQPLRVTIAESIHATDALPALASSTVINVAEAVHATDNLPAVTPSTLIAVSESVHAADSPAPVPVKVAPAIVWPAPSAIDYGAALGASQLDASSPVAGSFAYSPGAGAVPGVGAQTLSVLFTPTSTIDYTTATDDVVLIVNKASSSLAGPAPAAQPVQVANGQTVSIPVTVAGEFSGAGIATPSGSIAFTIGSGTPQTAAIAAGAAAVTIPSTQAPGLVTVYVTYPGDSNYKAAAPLSFQVHVGPQAQAISFAPLAPVTYGVAPFALSATATSGLAVNFTVKSGPATLSANILTVTGAGTVMIAADQPGNTLWQAATEVTQTLTVGKATPAIGLAASSNPMLVENAVTFTAKLLSSASAPTGTVNFLDGVTLLGAGTVTGGAAALTTSSLTVGSHSITAAYGGDANFNPVTSTVLTEVVDDFQLVFSNPGGTGSTASVTALPGGIAVFTMILSPVTGSTFPAPITFSASGLPAGATATFSPATLPAGAGTTTVTLTIQIPQTAAAVPPTSGLGPRLARFALALLLLPFAGRLRRRSMRLRRTLRLSLLLMAGAIVGLSACLGNGGSSGQAPQSYIVTVTGTSGALSHSSTVTLTIE